jgi:hypothetical protein
MSARGVGSDEGVGVGVGLYKCYPVTAFLTFITRKAPAAQVMKGNALRRECGRNSDCV